MDKTVLMLEPPQAPDPTLLAGWLHVRGPQAKHLDPVRMCE